MVMIAASAAPAHADNRTVPPWPEWQAPELKDHPLVGRIWSRAAGDFVSVQDYGTALAKARFVLLGEVHDNPDHHRLQAWAIGTISKLRGARLVEGAPQLDVVAMEMVNEDQREALDRFYGRNARVPRPRTAEDFGRILDWDKTGWPAYKIYQPVIEEALAAQLSIVPASPARAENRKVSKEGLGALAADEAERLALLEPLEPALEKDLAEEIEASHCGMLPAAMLGNMSLVQRLRDARMADAMLGSDSKGAVLIAGNGHVQRLRGVPWYLKRRGITDAAMTVVAHLEVRAGETQLQDYDLAGEKTGARELADFIVFTPRQTREEPCDEMKKQMEAIKAHRKAKEDGKSGSDAKSGNDGKPDKGDKPEAGSRDAAPPSTPATPPAAPPAGDATPPATKPPAGDLPADNRI